MRLSRSVLLVHATPLSHIGGAELSLRHHVASRPKHFRVDVITPDIDTDLSAYDAVILGNLRPNKGRSIISQLQATKHWIKKLSRFKGFIMKSERDIHPCHHRDARCIETETMRNIGCKCSTEIATTFQELYNSCHLVQFLSPLHQNVINKLVSVEVKQTCIASPVNLEKFRNKTPLNQRKAEALIIGDRQRSSPLAKILAKDAGYRIKRIYSANYPFKDMPNLYNQYQAVIVAPRMLHSFGRVAVEALACGCKLLNNDRVGALSWPDPVTASKNANTLFWDTVTQNLCELANQKT